MTSPSPSQQEPFVGPFKVDMHVDRKRFRVIDGNRQIVSERLVEKEAHYVARALNGFGPLVKACERLTNSNAECTCADGGSGFQCDVCEGRAALSLARGGSK